jgi:OmpA family
VYFDVGQSTLRADARASLDALLRRRAEAEWVRVEFTGCTDHDGDLAANLRLAQRRIASVQSYLHDKGGLSAELCESQAKGEADPLADNATPIGKSINRSVLVECKIRRRRIATLLEPAGMPPGRLPDTAKLPPVVPYDADCKLDTTIVLSQGTQLVFNRCEYLELQSGLEL